MVATKPVAKKSTTKKSSGRNLKEPLLPGSWQINTGFFLFFVLATAVLYSGDLHLGFFRIDDQQYVVKNPWIRSISMENISYILGHPYFVNYSQVHLFSYMLDYA